MSKGFINSLQSLGAADGPGIRFVVFMQGCNLRCGCCHNPDTWGEGGQEFSAREIADKAERFREYFGEQGGITVSGGEPLLQAAFVRELFSLCRERGINTCLDTSGSVWSDEVAELLSVTDRVLLDVKYTSDEQYKSFVGCDMGAVLEFLEKLNERRIPTTLRQVIIPTLNDNEESILRLRGIAKAHTCVDKVELLPFRKLCGIKYDNLHIEFPFRHIPEPTREKIAELEELLK